MKEHTSDLPIPPSCFLREVLDDIDIITSGNIQDVLDNNIKITSIVANELESVTGIDSSLWLNLDSEFRKVLANAGGLCPMCDGAQIEPRTTTEDYETRYGVSIKVKGIKTHYCSECDDEITMPSDITHNEKLLLDIKNKLVKLQKQKAILVNKLNHNESILNSRLRELEKVKERHNKLTSIIRHGNTYLEEKLIKTSCKYVTINGECVELELSVTMLIGELEKVDIKLKKLGFQI